MTQRMFVSVFRSRQKRDTYIYLQRGKDWDELPSELKELFGVPEAAMDLVLTPDRKLARATGGQVMEAIEDKGFFLQMPEKLDSYIVNFKEKLDRRNS